jgi:hypothetical protein
MTHRDIRALCERDWPSFQTRYLAWCHAGGRTVPADFEGHEFWAWVNHHSGVYMAALRVGRIEDQEAFSDYLWRQAVEEREGQGELEL